MGGDRKEVRGILWDLGEVREELEGLGEVWKVFEGKDFVGEVGLERVRQTSRKRSKERKKNLKESRAIMKRPQESEQRKDTQWTLNRTFPISISFSISFLSFLSFLFPSFPSLPGP